jgi:hypothetical protein
MKRKVKRKFQHTCYSLNEEQVFCYDCKGVQNKDSTFHRKYSQKLLMEREEVEEYRIKFD